MATELTITAVDFVNPQSGIEVFTFEYKLFSSSVWILISNTASVMPDGDLVSPLVVSPLTPGTVYDLMATSNCSSPAVSYQTQFNT